MNNSESLKERRVGQIAVPDDVKSRLTIMQNQALARLEGFGWSVGFVRRPLFQDEVVMLFDPSGQRHAVLNEDGTLDTSTETPVR